MRITVKDAMRIGGLQQCRVVAGQSGLSREIQYVTVMEVPDIIQWLKGHDLLLTSLYPIKDDEEAVNQLVYRLYEAGSSALAIKTHRYVEHIPQAIIDAGNELGLPIIEIANDVSYLDIMTPLMQSLLREDKLEQDNLEAFFKWITELAMSGKGIPAIVDAIQQIMDNRITVESDIPFLEATEEEARIAPLSRRHRLELKQEKRSVKLDRKLDGVLTPCIVTPILINDELYGYVSCWKSNREFEERDFAVMDRTVPLMALEFLKVITKWDVEQAYKDDFLSELLRGGTPDHKEAIDKARMFGWDLTVDYQVIGIAYEVPSATRDDVVGLSELHKRLIRKTGELFRFKGHHVIVTVKKDHLVILFPREPYPAGSRIPYHNDPELHSLLRLTDEIRQSLKEEFEELSFQAGIGRYYPGVTGIGRGYEECLNVLRLGQPLYAGRGSVHYEQLGIFRILSPLEDRAELGDFYEETLGELIAYDEQNGTSLVGTLREYFTYNCSLSETAESLYIHVNTMKYRLNKIEQITGLNVHNAEERLHLQIAMKIHYMREGQ